MPVPGGDYEFTCYLGDNEVTVKARFTPATPGTRDYPGDPAELAPLSVKLRGSNVDLLEYLADDVVEALIEQCEEPENWSEE